MYISKRSNGIYYVWFTDDYGRKQKVSTGSSSKTEALKFFRSFIKESREQRQRRLHPFSLSAFTSSYITYAKSRYSRSYRENIAASLRWLKAIVGDIPIHVIGARESQEFVGEISANRSDRTIRAYFVTLASAFEIAKRWEHIAVNPFRKIPRPRLRELIPAHFSCREFVVVLNAEPDLDLRELYICAVCTGMRLGELAALDWYDVDSIQRVIRVRNTATFTTKNRRNRTIPITSQFYELLAERKARSTTSYVFSFENRRITKDIASRNFKQCVSRAGVDPSIHFHSLRHSFASWLVQRGATLYQVQTLLGHSSSQMTEVYSHLQPEQMHSTVNRIDVSLK